MFRRKTSRRARRRLTGTAAGPTGRDKRPQPASYPVAENTGRARPGQPGPGSTDAWWVRLGRKTGALILTAAIFISVISVLALSPHAKIQTLATSKTAGALLRNQAEYQAAADKLLSGSLLNRNKITIDTGRISKQMTAQFPELASASVTIPLLGHRPTIYVEPAQASLVVAAGNGAYVVDQNGRALMPSADLPTAQKLPQIVDQSGLSIHVGRRVLTPDDVVFVQTVLAELSAKRVGVSSMVLPAASRELDVYIAGQPYFVKFNLENNSDVRQQAGTYLATIAELQRQHVTPAHYIDVRVNGRAYYQ